MDDPDGCLIIGFFNLGRFNLPIPAARIASDAATVQTPSPCDTLLGELRAVLHIHLHPQTSKHLHLHFHLGRADHPERVK